MGIQLNSINSFCFKFIDYAGLFPPANLDLNTSFDNYIKFKKSQYDFMLSGFICPIKLLPELQNLIESKYPEEKDIFVSVLADVFVTRNEFLEKIFDQFKIWSSFRNNFKDSVISDSIEIKIPEEVIFENKTEDVADFIDVISEGLKNKVGNNIFLFIEGSMKDEWKKNIKTIVEGIHLHNLNSNDTGFKLRTGGVKAELFPTAEQIAFSIRECIDRNVKLKCTAGLHHPFRHYDYELRTFMHGFINVFFAGIIAFRHNLSIKGMHDILNDENGNNFIFSMNCISWKDWKICIEEIELARIELMISFGSCSFDDPVDDMKKLKLLN